MIESKPKNHFLKLTYEQFKKNGESIADYCLGNKYMVYKLIARSTYGSIYQGMNLETNSIVAMKLLNLAEIQTSGDSQYKKKVRRKLAKSESEIMFKINSHHVMKCYDNYENQWIKIMVVEYCRHGTLFDQIRRKKRIPETEALQILKQLIRGLSAMHTLNIMHRDIKSENIMNHYGVYKIVDMGFAKVIDSEKLINHTCLGTRTTMAPEVLMKKAYGVKADIWSIGIVFYQTIYGQVPYSSDNILEEIKKNKNIFEQSKHLGFEPSPRVLDLLQKMLVADQEKRMSWKELLQHPALKRSPNLHQQYVYSSDIDDLNQNIADVKDRDGTEYDYQFKPEFDQESVNLLKIKLSEREKYQNKIDYQKDEKVIKWLKETHLECLKTEFFLKQIIIPIEDGKVLSHDSRKSNQLIYLISARCFINLSFFNQDLKNYNSLLVQNLKHTVKNLYKQAKQKFNYYDKQITQFQDRLSNVIKDRFRYIFYSQEIGKKNAMLTGIENVDFTKQEQIDYTYSQYIPHLKTKQNLNFSKPPLSHLSNYKKINAITVQDTNSRSFEEIVNQM